MRFRRLAAIAGLVALLSCGARSSLDAPTEDEGSGGGPLVCPAITTCGQGTPACRRCVDAQIAACTELSDCDAGSGGCAGNLPELHACRVWAAEDVSCLIDCPDETCSTSYFEHGRGPIYPFGLAFNFFDCAVCNACADVCSETPNFQVICNPK